MTPQHHRSRSSPTEDRLIQVARSIDRVLKWFNLMARRRRLTSIEQIVEDSVRLYNKHQEFLSCFIGTRIIGAVLQIGKVKRNQFLGP